MVKKKSKRFKPPWWLASRHLQSCFSMLFAPHAKVELNWEQLELPDGDFLDLCWAGSKKAPLIILLHGLEGSVDSHYIQLLLDPLVNEGWQVVLMHFRSCSGRLNRLPRSYHGADTQDLKYLIKTLVKRHPGRPMAAVGFSMGGAVLVKYAIENPETPFRCIIAVSVPFEFAPSADSLSQIYQWALMRTLKRKTIAKIKAGYDMPVTLQELRLVHDFRSFDDIVTAPLHGFANVDDYYEKATTRHLLKLIKHPALIIHALDDPLVPSGFAPTENDVSEHVTLEVYEKGGHVGFVQGSVPWKPEYWLRDRVLEFLKLHMRKKVEKD